MISIELGYDSIHMIRPLEYFSGLSLEEAEERYSEVYEAFERIKSNYPGLSGVEIGVISEGNAWIRRRLSKEDKETLDSCVGVLLLLGLEASAQEQLLRGKVKSVEDIQDTLWYKTRQILEEIILFEGTYPKVSKEGVRIDPSEVPGMTVYVGKHIIISFN